MFTLSRISLCAVFVVVAILRPAAADEPLEQVKQYGIKVVHPDAKDAASFIRAHRTIIGGWSGDDAQRGPEIWQGSIHYPVFNDRPEISFMQTIQVIKPDDEKLLAALSRSTDVLLAQSKEKPGIYEIAGYAAVLPDEPDDNWLPTARSLDYAKRFFHSAEYRYEKLLDETIKQLDDKNVSVRAKAARLLAEIGPDAEPAIDKIITLLDSDEFADKSSAILAIGKIGSAKARKAIPKITLLLRKNPEFNHVAIEALASFGKDSINAVPIMIQRLKAADQKQAPQFNYIIEALGHIAPKDPRVFNALTPYLNHEYETTRDVARRALNGEFLESKKNSDEPLH